MRRYSGIVLGVSLALLTGVLSAADGLIPGVRIPESVFQQMDVQKAKAHAHDEIKAIRQAVFDTMDTDRDGAITKAEFITYEKAFFARLDTKHDDVLTPDEITAAGKGYYATLDKNKTCQVTAGDCAAMLEAEFKAMDGQDQDGSITFEEYLAYWAKKDPSPKPAGEQGRDPHK